MCITKGNHLSSGFPCCSFDLLSGGRAEAAFTLTVCIIVYRDAVGQKNALRERIAGLYRQHLAVQIIACHLDQDMALVFCLEIVAVDDADRVIELKAMTEAQTRARIKLKHPASSIMTRIPVGIRIVS